MMRWESLAGTLARIHAQTVASKQWDEAATAASYLVDTVGSPLARPREGLVYAETAKGLAKTSPANVEATIHSHIGNILQALGRYRDAEAEHRTAVTIAEAGLGSDDHVVAGFRGALGSNLSFQGRLDEAEREQRKALALKERALGAHHTDVARARFFLGYTLSARSTRRGRARFSGSAGGMGGCPRPRPRKHCDGPRQSSQCSRDARSICGGGAAVPGLTRKPATASFVPPYQPRDRAKQPRDHAHPNGTI